MVMVGRSMFGSGDTGSFKKPRIPATTIATVNRVVATGRAINGAEMFIR
jgi:hypothetical protein